MAKLITDTCEIEVTQRETGEFMYTVRKGEMLTVVIMQPGATYREAARAALLEAGLKPAEPDPAMENFARHLLAKLEVANAI